MNIKLENDWTMRVGDDGGVTILSPKHPDGCRRVYKCKEVKKLVGGGANVVLENGSKRYVPFTCFHTSRAIDGNKIMCNQCGKWLGRAE